MPPFAPSRTHTFRALAWILGLGAFGLAFSLTTTAAYLPRLLQDFTDSTGVIGLVLGAEGLFAITLPLVVGPQLPAQTLIMGASKYAEAYEDRKGSIRAFEVNLLGWQVGYYGYACTVILQPTAFSHVIA